MREFSPFFGQIVSKNDISFMNNGNREGIVQLNNFLTNNLGGVIDGLDVVESNDQKTILISPGTIVSAGIYDETNNSGGGELAKLYTQSVSTDFPETPPQGSLPTYLLVIAQVSTSNINPNPLESQILVTSKNLQTGENVPTREYPKLDIIISNPLTESSMSSISGIPLAKFQVNYDGTTKSDSNGKIYNFDTSIKRNYIIGGSIDISEQKIVDAGIPDSLITTRMIADGQIAGSKLTDNSIETSKIAQWDGTSEYNSLTSSGVANQQLKDEAVTEEKLNYKLSLDGFNVRNTLLNSSFETLSGTTYLPETWYSNYDSTLGTEVRIDTGETVSKFGNHGLFLDGGVSAGNAQSVSVSQIIDFGESLKSVPITAFFWAKQTAEPNFATPLTTGLQGKIEFLNSSSAVVQTETFITLSGVTSVGYEQYTSTAPLLYTGTVACQKIRYTIGGTYDGSYYIDGAFLGKTSILPNFDVNPSEYVVSAGIADEEVTTAKIKKGAVTNNRITNADGSVPSTSDTTFGVSTGQIQDNAITTSKIANSTITAAKLAAGAGVVPVGAIILWDQSDSCPTGFTEATEFAGLFPIGRNASTAIGSAGTDSFNIGGAGRASTGTINTATTNVVTVSPLSPVSDVPGGGSRTLSNGDTPKSHSHTVDLASPFRTVLFCRKSA